MFIDLWNSTRHEKIVQHRPFLVWVVKADGQRFPFRCSALNASDARYWAGTKFGHDNILKAVPLH